MAVNVPEFDSDTYIDNVNKIPAAEMFKYAGRHVAFSLDGTRIVASGLDIDEVLRKLAARGIDSSRVVHSGVDPLYPSTPNVHVPGWDSETFEANKRRMPQQELNQYLGRCVAYSLDGTRILASGLSGEEVEAKLIAQGIDDSGVVYDYVPPPEGSLV